MEQSGASKTFLVRMPSSNMPCLADVPVELLKKYMDASGSHQKKLPGSSGDILTQSYALQFLPGLSS